MKLEIAELLNRGEIIVHIQTGLSYRFKKMLRNNIVQTECGKEFKLTEIKSFYCGKI